MTDKRVRRVAHKAITTQTLHRGILEALADGCDVFEVVECEIDARDLCADSTSISLGCDELIPDESAFRVLLYGCYIEF